MAEDNPFNQRVVLLLLAKAGHVVTVVNNGSEAVAAVDRQRFDVVLMDLQMPVMDGLQATAAIRASETGNSRHVPIIALTAHARKEDEECCLAAGMDGYISKPIREDQLYQAIEKCVSKWSIDPFNKKPCTERAGPTPSADLAAALDRVDGDRGFLGQMVAMFLEEAPALLEKIRHSVARRAGEALVAPAHTLKNWTGNFMAAAAIDALDRLEAAGRAGDWHAAAAAYAELEREFERLTRALEQFDAVPEVTADGDVALLCCEDRRSSPCTL
jgi:CheY-like chemotaxis protein/HPt (histidine-containing phosphotransfer) domain-containing protein